MMPNSDVNVTDNMTDFTSNHSGSAILEGSPEPKLKSDISHTDLIVQILCISVGFLGVIGNGFVVIVIVNFTQMRRKMTNYFIINQSMVDLACGVFTIATYATKSLPLDEMSDDVKDALCRAWLSTFPLWCVLTSSTYNLVALTLERYFKVVHPITHKNTFTKDKAVVVIIMVWLIGPLYHLPTGLPTTRMDGDRCLIAAVWPSETVRRLYGLVTVAFMFLVPVLIQAYCYVRIIHVLRRRTRPPFRGGVDRQPVDNFSRAQRNVIKTLVIVSLCYVLCWTGNQMCYLLFNLGTPVDFGSTFYHVSVIAVFSNCCINPFVYIFKYEEFQLSIRKLICRSDVQIIETSAANGSG